MVTDAKDFELLGDSSKMTGYSRPPEGKLTVITRILGICTAVALLMVTTNGMMIGMMSPYLAQFTAKNSTLPLTLNEVSWVASLVSLGRLLGAILGSIIIQYLGSKRTMLFAGCPFLLSWIFLFLANSANWLYGTSIARGIGMGMAFVSFPVYLGEISSPTNRGALVSFATSGLPLGNFFGTVMATYLSKSQFACVGLAPTSAYVLIFLCLPESPHFLIRTGRVQKAEESILRYNPKANVTIELASLKDFVGVKNSEMSFIERLGELKTRRNRNTGIIIILLNLFLHFSGSSTIIYYMEIILIRAKVNVVPPSSIVIIANVFDVIAGWMAVSLTEKYGRKLIWNISCAGASISMFSIGLHFTLLDNNYDSNMLQWLSIVFMLLFRIFVFLGLSPLPSIFLSELIAPNIKSTVVCVSNIFASMFIFATSKSYEPMVKFFGDSFVFYFYASVLIFAVIFGLTLMPETKGKTLQEIQNTNNIQTN